MNPLIEDIASFYDDPYAFVLYAFPWGEPGPLEKFQGPDEWQKDLLNQVRDEIRKRENGDVKTALRVAVSSGHGVGKSALTSWIILWFISTRPHPQILVTSNTLTQLTTKTWRELAKWHRMSIHKDQFEWTATKFYLKEAPETWFASAIPWSEHRPDAFAGTHEEHVLVIFDEASGIADPIWETVEGAMTTTGAMWFAFGNPIRNTGRFRQCFGRYRDRWIRVKVDSRTAAMANKDEIEQWRKDYGENSYFWNVRVLGEFHSSSAKQLISSDVVEMCRSYKAVGYTHMPYIMGVDVAREGDDRTVMVVRQGRKIVLIKKYAKLDNVQVVHYIQDLANGFPNITIFVDGVGIGSGVIDYGKLLGVRMVSVNAGVTPDDPRDYFNKRAEMWCRMRDWLQEGAEIGRDEDLYDELVAMEYEPNNKGQYQLESKATLKGRGLPSPDTADALALTFYAHVHPAKAKQSASYQAKTDWSVF